MNTNACVATAKQSFESLLALCDPRRVGTWNPSSEQRNAYIHFADSALDNVMRLEKMERRCLMAEDDVQSFVRRHLLTFIREQMKPRVPDIRAALDLLDRANALFREISYAFESMAGPGISTRMEPELL